MMTGSNFTDEGDEMTGGRHGYGAISLLVTIQISSLTLTPYRSQIDQYLLKSFSCIYV